MRIGILGAGASGLYSAILLKQKHPEADVVVFEKEEKIGRKLYATGNGHCNLLNQRLAPEDYSHPQWIAGVLAKYPYSYLKNLLESWGLLLWEDGDYVYPLSNCAANVVAFLSNLAAGLGVRFVLGTRVSDYRVSSQGIELSFAENKGVLQGIFDDLIIATGGASTPKLGSDGRFFMTLASHGYSLEKPLPGLAPIKVEHPETLKGMAGYRHDALVSLLDQQGKYLYSERGEVLFKDDGLSGIVVFNVESVYLRLHSPYRAQISLNLFPDETEASLQKKLDDCAKKNPSFYWDAFFPEEVQKHYQMLAKGKMSSFGKILQDDRYEIRGTYGFENSQVSVGGVSLSEVSPQLSSLKEKGVYFAGEALDMDGKCGGYNLSWALLSALLIKESL